MLERGLLRIWYEPRWRWAAWPLAPLAALFALTASARRWAYRVGLLSSERLSAPVAVIGNLTVGGSGKTPLTVWLARALAERGVRVGIVSRGYGGVVQQPMVVLPQSNPAECGDEPVMMAQQAGVSVAIARRRADAGRLLLQQQALDLLLCDDGLQHYALNRDLEIVVIDGRRGLGNGWLLPAGPMRESRRRLSRVDAIVVNGEGAEALALPADKPRFSMSVRLAGLRPVGDPAAELTDMASWRGRRVHAAAAIGDPGRFFDALRLAGLDVIEHPAEDHHVWRASELQFADSLPVLMTAKDAVKCRGFAAANWYSVEADVDLPQAAAHELLSMFQRLLPASRSR